MANYPLVADLNDFVRFKYCPFCGDNSVLTYDGDYGGYVYCLNEDCEEEVDFIFVGEVKHRRPESFKKWVEEL